eukprot:757379-Hanusia_phi.AAC.4
MLHLPRGRGHVEIFHVRRARRGKGLKEFEAKHVDGLPTAQTPPPVVAPAENSRKPPVFHLQMLWTQECRSQVETVVDGESA